MAAKITKPQKRLIIVHGWEGNPEEGWFPWLKTEMENRGWEVLVPTMPNAAQPEQSRWVPHLAAIVGSVDENTFMVGYSLGCITILRFLERLPPGQKIGGAIFVAGFDNPLKYKELGNFFHEQINWGEIKKRCGKFVSIHSEDDPHVPIENNFIFKEHLAAKSIIVNGFKHFSGDDGITSLPPLLQELLDISKE